MAGTHHVTPFNSLSIRSRHSPSTQNATIPSPLRSQCYARCDSGAYALITSYRWPVDTLAHQKRHEWSRQPDFPNGPERPRRWIRKHKIIIQQKLRQEFLDNNRDVEACRAGIISMIIKLFSRAAMVMRDLDSTYHEFLAEPQNKKFWLGCVKRACDVPVSVSRKRKPSNSFACGMRFSSRIMGDWGEAIQLPFGM